ncbi:MAG: GntR family transcriptional regulator [bacterium]|nr:GntR family transcriptional regulator [bacterium]
MLTDRIFDELKERVLRFDLKPGERLLEDGLAQEWQTSRTPIREALKRLAQAGLIRIAPRRGYYVREINLAEVEEQYEVRVALETFAVSLAVDRGRAVDWRALKETWGEIPEPLPSPLAMLNLDEGFHAAIAEAGGNGALAEYLRSISERIRAIRAKDFTDPHRVRLTYLEHARILKLIEQGDAGAASAAIRDHILESKANVLNAVKELLASIYLNR